MRYPFRAVPGVGLVLMLAAGVVPATEAAARPSVVVLTAGQASSGEGQDSGSMPGMAPDSMPGMNPTAATPPPPTTPVPGATPGSMPGMAPGSMPGMTPVQAGPVSRPRGLVLGGFAGIDAVVLLGALVVRRRTAGERGRRQAARATTRA